MSGLSSSLPERKRSYRVALTPLADAMFQLLIFFMLTTSLTPYSLLTLRHTAEAAPTDEAAVGAGAGTNGSTAPEVSRKVTLWSLGDNTVTTGGQVYERSQLPDLAEAMNTLGAPGTVIVVVTDAARVQDVAAALEALRRADIDAVQITTDGG